MKVRCCCSTGVVVVIVTLLLVHASSSHSSEGKKEGGCSPECTRGHECVDAECVCPNATSVLIPGSGDCLTAFNETGQTCSSNFQCRYDQGKCSDQGVCSCSAKFAQVDGRCLPYVKNAMIPIAIGVAIGVSVLGTLLLYLWLSRRKEGR